MASNLAELIVRLSEKEGALDELALILTEEQRCIVGLDTASLARIELRKEDVLGRLGKLQDACTTLLHRELEERGVADDRRLSSLVNAANGPERELLAPLQQRLAGRVAALERQFRTNREMLEHSLGLIRNSMELFVRMLGDCATYGARGIISSGSTGGLLLRREI
jgi:hypothetical protein